MPLSARGPDAAVQGHPGDGRPQASLPPCSPVLPSPCSLVVGLARARMINSRALQERWERWERKDIPGRPTAGPGSPGGWAGRLGVSEVYARWGGWCGTGPLRLCARRSGTQEWCGDRSVRPIRGPCARFEGGGQSLDEFEGRVDPTLFDGLDVLLGHAGPACQFGHAPAEGRAPVVDRLGEVHPPPRSTVSRVLAVLGRDLPAGVISAAHRASSGLPGLRSVNHPPGRTVARRGFRPVHGTEDVNLTT